MVIVDVTMLVVIELAIDSVSVRVTVVPLVASVAVFVPVGTIPTRVAVVTTSVSVLVTIIEGTVTVSVAVFNDEAVVVVAEAVLVAVSAAGKHRRIALQAVPLPHTPADGQRPSNLVHAYGVEPGRTMPPQPKLVTQAEEAWQLQPVGQLSVAVHT